MKLKTLRVFDGPEIKGSTLERPTKPYLGQSPYQPFYKPYGMSDEEYGYEKRLAENKLAKFQHEQMMIDELHKEALVNYENSFLPMEDQKKAEKLFPHEDWDTSDIIYKLKVGTEVSVDLEVDVIVQIKDQNEKWCDTTFQGIPHVSGLYTKYRKVYSIVAEEACQQSEEVISSQPKEESQEELWDDVAELISKEFDIYPSKYIVNILKKRFIIHRKL